VALSVSIIIPTYNEAENIQALIAHLRSVKSASTPEIIVSDGGSEDDTLLMAEKAGAISLRSPVKGRAGQMNHAAAAARGDVLYFVHADTRPPASFAADIELAVAQGYDCGSFRFRFDRNRGMLRLNSFFTRFNYLFFRGGDQSIFVTRALWQKAGPYREDMRIMEDYDYLARIWKAGRFKLIPKDTIVSARKYDTNSWLRVQLANLKVVHMYRRGASQQEMIDAYREALNYRRNAF
jgi:rSAM/selenodomain-associated transferase 2